jgi:hypothetical protein
LSYFTELVFLFFTFCSALSVYSYQHNLASSALNSDTPSSNQWVTYSTWRLKNYASAWHVWAPQSRHSIGTVNFFSYYWQRPKAIAEGTSLCHFPQTDCSGTFMPSLLPHPPSLSLIFMWNILPDIVYCSSRLPWLAFQHDSFAH